MGTTDAWWLLSVEILLRIPLPPINISWRLIARGGVIARNPADKNPPLFPNHALFQGTPPAVPRPPPLALRTGGL